MADWARGLLGGVAGLGKSMAAIGEEQSEYRMEDLKAKALYDREENLAKLKAGSAMDVAKFKVGAAQDLLLEREGLRQESLQEGREWEAGAGERAISGQVKDAMSVWSQKHEGATDEQKAAKELEYHAKFTGAQFQKPIKINEEQVQGLTQTILEQKDTKRLADAAKMTPFNYARGEAIKQVTKAQGLTTGLSTKGTPGMEEEERQQEIQRIEADTRTEIRDAGTKKAAEKLARKLKKGSPKAYARYLELIEEVYPGVAVVEDVPTGILTPSPAGPVSGATGLAGGGTPMAGLLSSWWEGRGEKQAAGAKEWAIKDAARRKRLQQ